MATIHLYDLINPQDPDSVEQEVIDTLSPLDPKFEVKRLRQLYRDVVALFRGQYPGYQASDAWYHDLEHTNTVFLCVAAMLNGAYQAGHRVSSRRKLVVLACALFHDVGLIRKRNEQGEGTGARFTVGHEQRSIEFMKRYFADHGYSESDAVDGRHIILCTALGKPLSEIPFRDAEAKLLGEILGSADLMAQMADRAYLEKLLLLYREFREGGIPGYRSELELLEKTPNFYRQVVKQRLDGPLNGVHDFLNAHARAYWGLDFEPFSHSIDQNLQYLDKILNRDKTHYRQWLRRGGITKALPRGD